MPARAGDHEAACSANGRRPLDTVFAFTIQKHPGYPTVDTGDRVHFSKNAMTIGHLNCLFRKRVFLNFKCHCSHTPSDAVVPHHPRKR